jgi:hypothetical protein
MAALEREIPYCVVARASPEQIRKAELTAIRAQAPDQTQGLSRRRTSIGDAGSEQ